MGMPFELNFMIITKDKEKRLSNSNSFKLVKDGYRLYPLDISTIEVRKTIDSDTVGVAEIKEVTWKEGKTEIVYELLKLKSTN